MQKHDNEEIAQTKNHIECVGSYFEMLSYVERLHRRLLDVIKEKLDKIHCRDINSVQALLIFNIGSKEFTAGELRKYGHYLGSNVSYNLKKLIECGYVNHKRSSSDRRSVRIRLTKDGAVIYKAVCDLFGDHVDELLQENNVSLKEIADANLILKKLEIYWSRKASFYFDM